MKITLLIIITLFFIACSKEVQVEPKKVPPPKPLKVEKPLKKEKIVSQKKEPKAFPVLDKELDADAFIKTSVKKSSFSDMPHFYNENFDEVLTLFKKNCRTKKAYKIYHKLCRRAQSVTDSRGFILKNFQAYRITKRKTRKRKKDTGLLTAYYEAQIRASRTQTKKYKYPVYATPKDLVVVDLSSIYPELKNYRLRGRIQNNRLVPYYTRKEMSYTDLNAPVLCYCDSKIDKFFLEIQGSGIAKFDDNSTMYIGYDNQNGHKYRAIGRYLVSKKELALKDVSLQSIIEWLQKHPNRVDEVLNYNNSLVFFCKRDQGATGALGVELTPMRSIAVDRRYIPLGTMLYLSAEIDEKSKKEINRVVFAQDTGGAIKGKIRADLFAGNGDEAVEFAGHLKAPLKLWLILPKKESKK